MLNSPARRISSACSPEAAGDGLEALAAQEGIQQAALAGIVIDDQDARRSGTVLASLGRHGLNLALPIECSGQAGRLGC